MNVIPCITWVRRGVAKSRPDRVKLSEDELSNLLGAPADDEEDEEEAESGLEGSSSDDENIQEPTPGKRKHDSDSEISDDITKRYNLDEYSDEDEEDEDNTRALSISGLSYYKSNKDDPYINKDDASDADEDIAIVEDDNLIVMGKVHEEYCSLNVYVYNEKKNYLYCHHDSLLPGFPLCTEWLDFDPGEEDTPGNLVAVGTMAPDIEIWDLDVIDTLEPAFVLAGAQKAKKKTKKKKMEVSDLQGHTDAVLDLSWNKHHRNVLASASADFTIRLWDLTEGKMVTSITEHTEKVQSVQWHPVEAETLLSGGFDKVVKVFDCRSPETSHRSWDVDGEVERVLWNVHNPFYFLASTDTGHVYCFDSRTDKSVFTLSAHTKAVSGIALSSSVPGCLVTTSADKLLKVWDISNNKPTSVFSKELKIGELHCLSACPDSGLMFAVGGEREMRVLNLKKQDLVASHFSIGKEKAANEGTWEVGKSDESQSESDQDVEKSQKTKKKRKKKKAKPSTTNSEGKQIHEQTSSRQEEPAAGPSATESKETDQSKKKKKKVKAQKVNVND